MMLHCMGFREQLLVQSRPYLSPFLSVYDSRCNNQQACNHERVHDPLRMVWNLVAYGCKGHGTPQWLCDNGCAILIPLLPLL